MAGRYRKIPVTIEAVQWTGENYALDVAQIASLGVGGVAALTRVVQELAAKVSLLESAQ